MAKTTFSGTAMFLVLLGLAVGGLAAIVHTAVVLAVGTAAPDQGLRFITGAGLIALAWCLGVSYAILGFDPPWKWGQRLCARIRLRHAEWQRESALATKRHLDGLPPEERERQLREIPEDSFLHPNNLPYDRAKPDRFE